MSAKTLEEQVADAVAVKMREIDTLSQNLDMQGRRKLFEKLKKHYLKCQSATELFINQAGATHEQAKRN